MGLISVTKTQKLWDHVIPSPGPSSEHHVIRSHELSRKHHGHPGVEENAGGMHASPQNQLQQMPAGDLKLGWNIAT